MGGKRQLVIRQIRVLRGGKRQGSKVEEEGADQIRKEKKISKGAAMPMAAQIFGYFFWERTWRDIFRTVSHLQSGPTGERRQRLSEGNPIGEERNAQWSSQCAKWGSPYRRHIVPEARQRHFLTMLGNKLRILQLNIMKSRAVIEALINDHQSQNLDILLIQEPSITAYRTRVNHTAWRLYQATVEDDSIRFRNLTYVNRKLSTASYRQVQCSHSHVTAIKIWTADHQFLVFSVYIPPVPMHTPDEGSAGETLSAIHHTIQTTTLIDKIPATNPNKEILDEREPRSTRVQERRPRRKRF